MHTWDTRGKMAPCICRGWGPVLWSSFMSIFITVNEPGGFDGLRLVQVNFRVFCILGNRSVSTQEPKKSWLFWVWSWFCMDFKLL